MKFKKILFFFTLSNIFIFQVFAQLDITSKGKEGATNTFILESNKEAKKPSTLDLSNENGFKNAYKKEKQQQEKDAINNHEILTTEKLNEERFFKNFKKINGQYIYPKIDQNLGSFRTNSKSVNIICRDFQYPDGDRVTIFVNDIPVVVNIVLKQNYQAFSIPLEVGLNKIAFKALNQGTSGPNTAAFKVYNDAGMLISSNEWNLATGAKATLIIAKDK